MRRLLCVLLAVLLGLTLTTAVPASASIPPPNYTRVTWSALRAAVPTMHISASRATGYGQMSFTGLVYQTGGGYRASYHLYNRSPLVASATAATGFCWPWFSGSSHSACWNQPWTWNWSKIFPPPGSSFSYARQYSCSHAALSGWFGIFGKPAIAALFGYRDLFKFTASGFAIGAVVSCAISLWW